MEQSCNKQLVQENVSFVMKNFMVTLMSNVYLLKIVSLRTRKQV